MFDAWTSQSSIYLVTSILGMIRPFILWAWGSLKSTDTSSSWTRQGKMLVIHTIILLWANKPTIINSKSSVVVACIYSPEWTTGLDYWTDVGVVCACSKTGSCALKRISVVATPCVWTGWHELDTKDATISRNFDLVSKQSTHRRPEVHVFIVTGEMYWPLSTWILHSTVYRSITLQNHEHLP